MRVRRVDRPTWPRRGYVSLLPRNKLVFLEQLVQVHQLLSVVWAALIGGILRRLVLHVDLCLVHLLLALEFVAPGRVN